MQSVLANDGLDAAVSSDDATVRSIVQQLVSAWNRGNATDFAAPFSDQADFVAFEGTHLQGRVQIEAFHERWFATVLKGTRLEGDAAFVHFLTPELAVMHAVANLTLAGSLGPAASRESMQLFVMRKQPDGSWLADAVMNARKVSLERQQLWDDYGSLSETDQRQVAAMAASLKG